MRLVPDWKDAWKWHSIQLVALAIALPDIWAAVPPELIDMIPPEWLPRIQTIVLVGALIGRIRDQGVSDADLA